MIGSFWLAADIDSAKQPRKIFSEMPESKLNLYISLIDLLVGYSLIGSVKIRL